MATNRWLGRALAVAQVDTLTVGGTVETDDIFIITINGKALSVTAGSTVVDTVAGTIATAFNNSTEPEFAEITAAAVGSGGQLTLTADTAGKPFTATVSTTEAGGGAADTQTFGTSATTASEGPNHWDVAENWDQGAVPVDGDDIVIDQGSVDIKYGLDQSAVSPASLTVTMEYTGKIGLPSTNSDDSTNTYREYRDTFLKLSNSGDATTCTATFGQGSGTGSGRLKVDFNTGQTDIIVHNTGIAADTGVPPLLVKGSNSSNTLTVTKGNVGAGWYATDMAAFATVDIGQAATSSSDAQVSFGTSATLTSAAITQNGGSCYVRSATSSGSLVINAGTLYVMDGAHASLTMDGGTVYYQSTGTLTTANVRRGTLSFARDLRARTVTNCTVNKDGSLLDPSKSVTFTNGIDLYGRGIQNTDGTINLGTHFTISLSTI